MRKKEGAFFYGAKNKNGHQRSPKRFARGIAWKKGFGISEISAGRQKKSSRKGNAEGGKAGGAGKYKDPPQEGQAEGIHSASRASGVWLWWCEENISDKNQWLGGTPKWTRWKRMN